VAADELLAQVEGLLPVDEAAAVALFEPLLAEGSLSLDALRELARGIFPKILSAQGVVPALRARILQDQPDVEVDIEGWEERFDPGAEARVYFCVVQALANAGAYAPGSHVTVRLAALEDRLEFDVRDDGPGVDAARLAAGADIQDMRDRVEAAGGVLEARSELGAGTVVSGWVPARVAVGA
jgi:signal transduction histidine kinase